MPTVIYCDGGAREGLAGWGVYIMPDDTNGETIEVCGGLGPGTNNAAELKAFAVGLQWVLDNKVDKVLFLLDSEYVIKGAKYRMNRWRRDNWVKQDGKIVANVGLWKEIAGLVDAVGDAGLRWKIDWVKGHSGDHGNDKADALATRGINHSRAALPDYWSNAAPVESDAPKPKFKPAAINPLLWTSNGIFVTGCKESERATAESVGFQQMYMLAAYEDKDDLKGMYLAKPSADACFGIAFVNKEEPLLETVRERQEAFGDSDYNVPSQFLLRNIYSKKVQEEIHALGKDCLSPEAGCVSLWGNLLLTRYMVPCLRSSFGLQKLNALVTLYQDYLKKGERGIITFDITDQIYEEGKKNYEVIKGKIDDKKPIFVKFDLNGVAVKHQLTHNIDIPSRNTMQRIAKECEKPKVELLVYSVNELTYRSALVIHMGNEVGIYAPSESDYRLLIKAKR